MLLIPVGISVIRSKAKLQINVFAKIAEVKNIRSVDVSESVKLVTVIYLRDSSVDSFTRCIIYSELTDIFAGRIKIGHIIQLNQIHVRTNAGRPPSLFGKLDASGFGVKLISDKLDSGFNIDFQSSSDHNVPENCEEMIAALRIYSNNMYVVLSATNSAFENSLQFNNRCETVCRLNQLMRFQYHNIVVQVLSYVEALSVFISDRGNVVLRCWDTTDPPSSAFFFMNENISETIFIDEEMVSLAWEHLCDIVFYNEHGDYLKKNVKPGDILLLVNVHYYMSQNGSMLTVHEGGKRYNRGITILEDSSSHKAKLLNDVKAFVTSRTAWMQKVSDISLKSEVSATEEYKTSVTLSVCGDSDVIKQPATAVSIISMKDNASVNYVESKTPLMTKRSAIAAVFAVHLTVAKGKFVHDGEARIPPNLRQHQIKALQLGWIATYIIKKWISERNLLSLSSSPLSFQRSYVLAKAGTKFLIMSVLTHLRKENKDILRNFAKMVLFQKSLTLQHYLLLYLKGTYENTIRSNMIANFTRRKKMCERYNCSNDEERVIARKVSWELIKWIIPGTSLNLSNWSTSLSCNFIAPMFALICSKCGLWRTTSAEIFEMYGLCPICFQKGEYWQLRLQCYFVFNDLKSTKAFFLINVPNNAVSAALKWKNGLEIKEKQKIFNSIQEIFSKYSFAFTKLKVRKVCGTAAFFEVEKLVFADRLREGLIVPLSNCDDHAL
uniref:Protection of telomeres protein 1 ssDNA-binding domain-containing protein n=1 Tax=Setaria digitata TaxID=48799 RepID=A0A915PXN6_9BILA